MVCVAEDVSFALFQAVAGGRKALYLDAGGDSKRLQGTHDSVDGVGGVVRRCRWRWRSDRNPRVTVRSRYKPLEPKADEIRSSYQPDRDLRSSQHHQERFCSTELVGGSAFIFTDMKALSVSAALLSVASAKTIQHVAPPFQHTFSNPPAHDEGYRIPSVRESAAMARKIMHLTTIGDLVSVFPGASHGSHVEEQEDRPKDIAGSPIGLMVSLNGWSSQASADDSVRNTTQTAIL